MHGDHCLPEERVPGVPGIPAYILFQSAGLSLELLHSPLGDTMLAAEVKQHQYPPLLPVEEVNARRTEEGEGKRFLVKDKKRQSLRASYFYCKIREQTELQKQQGSSFQKSINTFPFTSTSSFLAVLHQSFSASFLRYCQQQYYFLTVKAKYRNP